LQEVFYIKKKQGLKSVFQAAAVYVTSIVGAGFATGEEIKTFFTSHGKNAPFSILLATTLFCALGAAVLSKANKEKSNTLDDLLLPRVGPWPAKIIKLLMALFQLLVFIIMQAGLITMLQAAGLPELLAYFIVVPIMVFLISSDIRRVVLVNSLLAPAIIAGIISTSAALILLKGIELRGANLSQIAAAITCFSDRDLALAITCSSGKTFLLNGRYWLLSPILYVSYNSLLFLPILSGTGKNLPSPARATSAGILGGALTGLMALSVHLALRFHWDIVGNSGLPAANEIPMVYLGFTLGRVAGIAYSIVVFFSMICSATISGHGTLNRLAKRLPLRRITISTLLSMLGIPLSWLGFGSLIETFYPIFGAAGIFVMLILLLK